MTLIHKPSKIIATDAALQALDPSLAAAPHSEAVLKGQFVSAAAQMARAKKPKKNGKARQHETDEDLPTDQTRVDEAEHDEDGSVTVLAQASPTDTPVLSDGPTSVGEALLKQSQPLPPVTPAVVGAEAAATSGILGASWSMPVLLGAGALGLAAIGGGSGGTSPTPSPGPVPPDGSNVLPPPPETYDLKITPMVGRFAAGGIQIKVMNQSGEILLSTELLDGQRVATDGSVTVKLKRSAIKSGDLLQIQVIDSNGSATNYLDTTTNQNADLGTTLRAWTAVPSNIADVGVLNLAVTPLTELAVREIGIQDVTQENIQAANNAIAQLFDLQTSGGVQVDLVQTPPVATNMGTLFGSATAAQQAYGRALAMVSSLAKQLSGTGPVKLSKALDALASGIQLTDPSTASIEPGLKEALRQALIDYNLAAGTSRFKLPGLVLAETVSSLDQEVSYGNYDDGLTFDLYAPPGLKKGDVVTIRLYALDEAGQPTGAYFDYQHTLVKANATRDYTAEKVTIPTMMGLVELDERQAITDANGNRLIAKDASGQGIGIGQADANGIYSFQARLIGPDGSTPLDGLVGSAKFDVNGHRVSIVNLNHDDLLNNTLAPYVKAGDTIEVRVVLDNDILWSAENLPTFTLSYTTYGSGEPVIQTKTLQIEEGWVSAGLKTPEGITSDGTHDTASKTSGRVLIFKHTFDADEKAMGPITVAEGALKMPPGAEGLIFNRAGHPLLAAGQSLSSLVPGGTQVADAGLQVDTVAPVYAGLVIDDAQSQAGEIGDISLRFTQDGTPNFSIQWFKDLQGEEATQLDSTHELKDLTLQLYAYLATDERGEAKQIAQINFNANASSVSLADDAYGTYAVNWNALKAGLPSTGALFKFYVKVIDAAGNTSELSGSQDTPLWLDQVAPLSPSIKLSDTDSNLLLDPLPDNTVIGDDTPTFSVRGEAGVTAQIYLDNDNDGLLDEGDQLLATGTLSGEYGDTEPGTASLTSTETLDDGEHTLLVTLSDKAGNQSAVTAMRVTVDTGIDTSTPPTYSLRPLAVASAPGYYKEGDTLTIQLKMAEAIYLNPEKTADSLSAENLPKLSFTVGGTVYQAVLDTTSLGRDTLDFQYTFTAANAHNGDAVTLSPLTLTGLGISSNPMLVDRAGNPVTIDVLVNQQVTAPGDVKLDTIAPEAPVLTFKPEADTLVSLAQATSESGLYTVQAEAGTRVKRVWRSANDTSVTQEALSDGTAQTLLLSETDIAVLGQGQVTLTVTSTDQVGHVSSTEHTFTLDTLAPVVERVIDDQTAEIVGLRTGVEETVIAFTVQLKEPLSAQLTRDNLNVKDGKGSIETVTQNMDDTYVVRVKPKAGFEGQLVLQLLNNSNLTDLAGNPLAASTDLDTVGGVQRIDTQAPVVTQVTDNLDSSVTNAARVVFTVSFNEAIQDPGSAYDTRNFQATHATVTEVKRLSETQYQVTVTPHANLAANDIELSFKAGPNNFRDQYGNQLLVPDSGISLAELGGMQRVDNVSPEAPVLAAVEGAGALTQQEAQVGAFTVTAEPGASVSVTLTRGAQSVQKTFTAEGTKTVTLDAAELAILGDGTVQVSAVVTDAAGNQSTSSLSGGLVLDTRAPQVTTVIDAVSGAAGGSHPKVDFTVSFDEEVIGAVTPANFSAIDPTTGQASMLVSELTDADVVRIDTKTFMVSLTPRPGVAGTVALQLSGAGLTDSAGNAVQDQNLASFNTQVIQTVAPVVTTVTDTYTAEYLPATGVVDFQVTFDQALSSTLTASALQSGFSATNGTVTAVSSLGNNQYKVSVSPHAGVADGTVSLQLTGKGLVDALGNRVAATTGALGNHTQKIDTLAPATPVIALDKRSDTGVSDADGITADAKPQLNLSGLETGATVQVYLDANGNGRYDTEDTLLLQAVTASNTLSAQINQVLADGIYNDIRLMQQDVHGNASSSALLASLEISTSAPGQLSGLELDEQQDTTNNNGVGGFVRDGITDRAAPTFNFSGGTEGNVAIVFNDKNTNNLLDDGEYLGQATIQNGVTSSVSVDPLHALVKGEYTQIKVLQESVSGIRSEASLSILATQGHALFINPAPPAAITISSSESSTPSNKATLSFTVTGGQSGGTIQVMADQYDATGVLVASKVKLPETALSSLSGSDNLTIDVSQLHGEFRNFTAYQRYAGVNSASTAVTGLTTVTLDHTPPTLTIQTSDAELQLGETATLSFVFSEAITGFEASDVTGLGDNATLTNLASADGGKTWTALYTPAANAQQTVTLSVATGAISDAAGNANLTASTVTLAVDTRKAPEINAPAEVTTNLFAGVAGDISGITVQDANHNLASITLSVTKGTLSINALDAAVITASGLGTQSLTLQKADSASDTDFETALATALQALQYTAQGNSSTSDTLSITATDGVLSTRQDVSLSIAAAPQAPVNALTVPVGPILAGESQAISITVQDADNNLQSVQLSVKHGELALTASGDATVSSPSAADADGWRTITVTGSQANIASTLSSLTYTADVNYIGEDSIRVQSTDATPAVASGPKSDTDTVSFTVKARPVSVAGADVGADQIYADQAFTLQGMRVSDADQGLQSIQLQVSDGVLTYSGEAPLTLTITGAGTSTLSLVKKPEATPAQFEAELAALLERIQFTASTAADTAHPVTLTITSTDADGLIGTDTSALTVQAAPIAPVNALAQASVGVISGESQTVTGLSVADDDGNLQKVQLSVSHGTLALGSTSDQVTVTGGNTAELTLTIAAGADLAQLNAVLASLVYTPQADHLGADTLRMTSTDATDVAAGGARSDTDTLALSVLSKPVNVMGDTLTDIQAQPGRVLSGLAVTDADSSTQFGQVRLYVEHGQLEATAIEGVRVSGLGTAADPLLLTSTDLTNINTVLAQVRYTPSAQFVGTDVLHLTSQDHNDTALGGPLSDTDTLNLGVVNSPVSGSVTIEGSAHVGQRLSANISQLNDANGLGEFQYQWYRGDEALSGATGSTYQLTSADIGQTLKLVVSYIDGARQSESVSSATTVAVDWPSSLPLGKLLAFASDSAFHQGPTSTESGASFILGQGQYYILDVNADGVINGSDRTTYAIGLDSEGNFTTASGLRLQLLSTEEWAAQAESLLQAGNGWPDGSRDNNIGNTASDGSDFWTRSNTGEPGQHDVYSTAGIFKTWNDASGDNALHYHVFKVY